MASLNLVHQSREIKKKKGSMAANSDGLLLLVEFCRKCFKHVIHLSTVTAAEIGACILSITHL